MFTITVSFETFNKRRQKNSSTTQGQPCLQLLKDKNYKLDFITNKQPQDIQNEYQGLRSRHNRNQSNVYMEVEQRRIK